MRRRHQKYLSTRRGAETMGAEPLHTIGAAAPKRTRPVFAAHSARAAGAPRAFAIVGSRH